MNARHLFRSILRSLQVLGYFAWFGLKLLLTRPETRQGRAGWLHAFASSTLRGVGLRLTVEGDFPGHGVLISNHVGYLDIVVFAALRACVFVSKAEIAHWPLLGWMTTMAGTVYVERGRGGSALRARSGMEAASEAGLPVVFFPEGTTSNGEQLLLFHSGLLAQTLELGIPMTAAAVTYTLDDPNAARVTVRDHVNYWGEASLLPHVFFLLGLRGIHAHVRFAPGPIAFSADALSRKRAAEEARAAVAALLPAAVTGSSEAQAGADAER